MNDTPPSTTATSEIIINKEASYSSLPKSVTNNTNEETGVNELEKTESSASLTANASSFNVTSSLNYTAPKLTLLDDTNKFYSAANRIKKFPSLNYVNLYNALINLIEIIPTIQLSPVGQALIHTMSCLTPFLSDEILETLPYTIALTLTTFPKDLQKCIIDSLCNNFLPIACNFNKISI